MTTQTLTPASTRQKVPAGRPRHIPAAAARTNILLLCEWRDRGWLTPPGARRRRQQRFDWAAAIDQIGWLWRLHQHTCRRLDREDADAGWRLRALGAPYAVRALPGGRWEPIIDLDTWSPPDGMYTIAAVNPKPLIDLTHTAGTP